MQIQVIEQKTGLDRATIRYYEQEGLIKPQRLQNGYRDYSERNLQDLLKIKLLRQVGLSIETIQSLSEGKEDLQLTLENQIILLKEHRAQIDNAEAICARIMQDHVTYQTFVPSKYFVVPNQKKCIENSVIETTFTEYVYLESHPVRRFVGRYLDQLLTSAILLLIVVVFMRVRPFGNTQNNLLSVAALFLSMPINAFCLCIFGTTPGKFVVGIYLKTPEGKNMTFWNALQREWAVFRCGMGFNIPIYNIIRLIKSYNIHTAGRELEWDYDYNADILYTEWDARRGVLSAVLGIICIITIACAAVDAQLPKHRSTDLTLAQFAENYNIYANQNNMVNYLSEEGEWYTQEIYPNTIIVDMTNSTECWSFITNDEQELERITIKTTSNSRLFTAGKISLAIHTAILSQPDADILAADEAAQALSEMVFISELGSKNFDFGGVIVNIEFKQLADIYEATVNITIP